VLVVEDDAALQLLCRFHLEAEGCRVLPAFTLAEASEALEREPVDVMLLDVHVGSDDGRAFLVDLRRQGDTTPVALFTGGPCEVDDGLIVLAGALLAKPFGLDELSRTVRQLASRNCEAAGSRY
jgi:two-component system OmpR family response regulator